MDIVQVFVKYHINITQINSQTFMEMLNHGEDFVIVIEDKADLAKHEKLTDTGVISTEQKDIVDYAVNVLITNSFGISDEYTDIR